MTISHECKLGVLTLQIDRPEKLNALSIAMFHQLSQELTRAEQDDTIKVVVLKGRGGSFTSGNDLSELIEIGNISKSNPAIVFLKQMVRFPKPIIADVHGHAIGIGTTVLLHCDLVIADPKTRFQIPFVQLGLVPEFASSYLLPRYIGPQRAAELLMLGEPFSAQQALQWGLINRVAEHEEREGLVQEWACKLIKLPQEALRQTKALMRQDVTIIETAINHELSVFGDCLHSPECQKQLSKRLRH